MNAFWQEHLEREPRIAPYLAVLARKFVRSGTIPKSITLGVDPEDPGVRRALAFLFGGGDRKDGTLVVRLPERLRTAEALQALADRLGIAAEPDAGADCAAAQATAVLRQGLNYPQYAEMLNGLRNAEELTRLFQNHADAEKRLQGVLRAVAKLEANRSAITLSQLGAEALNDSKALRTGALRKLLVRMLAWVADAAGEPPERVLARFGVVDNPYTTLALLYGPVAYADASGRVWDWPAQLHADGKAVALTWAQVQGMQKLYPVAPVEGVITSENAAPFHHLVESRSSSVCVYTEGYPNAAVMRVLELLAQSGLRARHGGDTDLDGLRIAEYVSRGIPVELRISPRGRAEIFRDRLIPLTDAQRRRATAYLAAHPEFRFRDALVDTLQHGWLEQEQTCGQV
ncbi:MAG: DUF2399 domain-containing protein [bacterium]